jgi:hypothetical protein
MEEEGLGDVVVFAKETCRSCTKFTSGVDAVFASAGIDSVNGWW